MFNVKICFAVAILAATTGCTDAARARFDSLSDEATVTCYSGGTAVFTDTSTGVIEALDGGGLTYMSKNSGRLVRAFADCIVTN